MSQYLYLYRMDPATRREAMSPERAHAEFDETTLQLFWMRWPRVSSWSGSLWRMLSEELSGPSAPHTDPELDEVGEGG